MRSLQKSLVNSLKWNIIGQIFTFFLSFITNFLLARILLPKDFGVVAIATFLVSISKVFIESGLSGAIIRKPDASERDLSTIFIFNFVISVFLYTILFILSPLIEDFYNVNNLSLYIKTLGIILILNSFYIIQNAHFQKLLQFKKIVTYNFFSFLIASFIAVVLAFNNYGIWALISLHILNSLTLVILYSFNPPPFKKIIFCKKSFRSLYGFGFFTTFSSIINTSYANVFELYLGKSISLSDAGLFSQCKKIIDNSLGIIRSNSHGVLFSVLSKIQNDKIAFDYLYSQSVRIFSVIVGLISMIFFNFSEEILFLFYGEKWITGSFYLKILSLVSFFTMQETFNRILFKIFNRTENIFYIELITKSISFLVIIYMFYLRNIENIMISFLILSILSYFLNYFISRRIFKATSIYTDLLNTLKVFFVIVFISLISYYAKFQLQFFLFHYILMIISLVIVYFWTLSILRVFNLKREIFLFVKNVKD